MILGMKLNLYPHLVSGPKDPTLFSCSCSVRRTVLVLDWIDRFEHEHEHHFIEHVHD